MLALVGAVGAGAGFSSLSRQPLSLRRVAAVTGGAAVTIALWYIVAEANGALGAPSAVRRESIGFTALLLAAAAGLLAAPGRLRYGAALSVALAVSVLSLLGLQNLNVILAPQRAYPVEPLAIKELQEQPEPFRLGVVRDSVNPLTLPALTSALYGLEGIEGYDYPLSQRWSEFQTSALGFGGSPFPELRAAREPPSESALAALRMMNVGYYLAAPGTRPATPDFETAYRGPDAVVFRDPGALPRAYVVPKTRVLSDRRALALLAAGRLDPRRVALVPPGTGPVPRGGGARFQGARAEQRGPDQVRVHVPPGAAGWLVLANAYSPGWKAEVNGREAELRPANFAAMGVPVTSSTRVVDFRLDRSSFWLGATISLAALAFTALLAGLGRRRPRRAPRRARRGAARSLRP